MNAIIKNIFIFIALFSAVHCAFAQNENPVISAIQKEVDRNKAELKMENMAPPFFISYSVVDIYNYYLSASMGNIDNYNENHVRRGVPSLLVGDYLRNNLNLADRGNSQQATATSLYDNDSGISMTIWKDLDNAYKKAIEQYKTKMAIIQQQTQTDEEKALPDFEQVNPVNIVLQPVPVKFDRAYWENFLRKASETAKLYPDILSSSVSLNVRNVMNYTYNTEGSRYAVPTTFYQLMFNANTRAGDGQELDHTLYTENATFEQMPDIATYIAKCKELMENLLKVKNAPVINEAYSGPVLFEGKSVEYLFRSVFFDTGKLYAAPRAFQSDNNNYFYNNNNNQQQLGGNVFELMLDKKVISRSITMKSITGQEFYNGQRLNGYYPVDAEGVVPDKELTLIDNGVLRNLLNGRKPTKKIQHSNGHVRYDYNSNSFGIRPGNILITCNQTFSDDELRKKLIDAAKEEDLDYAFIVYDMFLGIMSKIYVSDGHEELVRGATLSDITTKTLKRVIGASDKEQIYSFSPIQSTVIFPGAMLLEEVDITRMPNIEFKKPYIVPKPN